MSLNVYEHLWMAPRAGFDLRYKLLKILGLALRVTGSTPTHTPSGVRAQSIWVHYVTPYQVTPGRSCGPVRELE